MRCFWLSAVLLIALAGCSKEAELPVAQEPSPRPVSVIKLRQTDPARSLAVTGVVGSWKTEDIGFEVSGRVNYVIEPELNVRAETDEAETDEAGSRQPLARIDDERYKSAVASAKAKIDSLVKQMTAAEIEKNGVVPAQVKAAEAAKKLAESDFGRAVEAFEAKAIPPAEYAKYEADKDAAVAKVAQLKATLEARSADVASLAAQIEQAQATLNDAELDLEDCTLYAPFSSQIAEVHVIPGGTVQRGEPVVTVQMMNPMKVEFEVSAERVRKMSYKDTLDVILTRPDGSTAREEAIVYKTDAVADPSTRTFTITLLLKNHQIPAAIPDDVDASSLAKTRDLWKCIGGIIDDSDDYFIAENAICEDDKGQYLWKVIETAEGRSRGPLFKVEKVRVTSGHKIRQFLGLWKFLDVVADDPSTFDITQDRVVGKIELADGKTEFDGDTVLLDLKLWLLRPGDLAKVDLVDSQMPRGFYVPMDAINKKSGKDYVFVVEGDIVRRVEVSVADGPNTLKRIAAVPPEPGSPELPELTEKTKEKEATQIVLKEATQIVLGGVHYLVDGEAVNVAAEVERN